MAIQFNCPYCTASIRVPDSASGKQGTCPKCSTKILVPTIEVPPASEPSPPAAAGDPAVTEGQPEAPPEDAAAPPMPDDASLGGEPQFPSFAAADPVDDAPQPSVARRYKKRTKRKKSGLVVPVMFGSVLVGSILYLYWTQVPKLEGEVRAAALEEAELPPGLVSRRLVDLPKDKVDLVLEGLTESPERLKSQIMSIEFRGSREGIQVTLEEGSKTQFYRVSINADPELQAFYDRNARRLSAPQEAELQEAATAFFEAWAAAAEENEELDDLASFRDRLGLTTLVGGLGYHLQAICGSEIYRCVYENERYIYFLLPHGTKKFEIQGRELKGSSLMFPGHYTAKVVKAKVVGKKAAKK